MAEPPELAVDLSKTGLKLAQLKDTIRQNRSVAFLCLSIFAITLGVGAITPVLPLFIDSEYQVNQTQVAVAVGLFASGRIVTSIPAGYLAQRYGRRIVMIIGTIGNLIGATMVALSFSYGWLVGSRIVSGLGASIYATGVSVYLRDMSTPETRGRYLSLQDLSVMAGVSIGPVLGGLLGGHLGLRAPLYLQAALTLCSLALIIGLVPESKPETAPQPPQAQSSPGTPRATATPPGDYRRLLLNPAYIIVGLLGLAIVAHRQGGRFSIMPIYGEDKGFGPGQLGIFLSITHFIQFFAVLAAGILSDRFGRKFTIMPAAALVSLGILVFILSGSFAELMAAGVLLGAGEGLAGPPLLAFFADIAPPGMEGVTMGFFRSFGGAGALVGTVLLGRAADLLGFAWSLRLDALLLTTTALAMVLLVRETGGRRIRQVTTPS